MHRRLAVLPVLVALLGGCAVYGEPYRTTEVYREDIYYSQPYFRSRTYYPPPPPIYTPRHYYYSPPPAVIVTPPPVIIPPRHGGGHPPGPWFGPQRGDGLRGVPRGGDGPRFGGDGPHGGGRGFGGGGHGDRR